MKTSNLSRLDSLLNCGVSLSTLDVENTPTEFATLSNRPTSKTKIAPRNYPHTPEQIAKELRIDNEGNLFWRRARRGRSIYKPVGTIGKNTLLITLDSKSYAAHAIAFCLYHSRWPLSGLVLDHINNNPFDNRKENLREVTNSVNALNRARLPSNNTSGVMGVFWESHKQRWKSTLWVNNKLILGGHFKNLKDAIAARWQLEIDYGVTEFSLLTKQVIGDKQDEITSLLGKYETSFQSIFL